MPVRGRACDIPAPLRDGPYCESRADRYRLEPVQASSSPDKFVRPGAGPAKESATDSTRLRPAGLRLFTYNSDLLSIEHIDDQIESPFYGHDRRGSDCP